jgi:hypothetical protein
MSGQPEAHKAPGSRRTRTGMRALCQETPRCTLPRAFHVGQRHVAIHRKSGVSEKSPRRPAGWSTQALRVLLLNMPLMRNDHPIMPMKAVMKNVDSCPGM